MHAFDEYGGAAPDPRERINERVAVPSPLTSETETEDSGITFVAKRGTGARRGSDVSVVDMAAERQGGHTISESELMRRRRLLDSHIFEGE